MHNLRRSISILALTFVLTTAAPLVFRATPSPVDPTILIINVQLADGTGATLKKARSAFAAIASPPSANFLPRPAIRSLTLAGWSSLPASSTFTTIPSKASSPIRWPNRKSPKASPPPYKDPTATRRGRSPTGSPLVARILLHSMSPSSPDMPPFANWLWARTSNAWPLPQKSKK